MFWYSCSAVFRNCPTVPANCRVTWTSWKYVPYNSFLCDSLCNTDFQHELLCEHNTGWKFRPSTGHTIGNVLGAVLFPSSALSSIYKFQIPHIGFLAHSRILKGQSWLAAITAHLRTNKNILISYYYTLFIIDSSMYSARLPAKLPLSKQSATRLSKAVASFNTLCCSTTTHGLRCSPVYIQRQQPVQRQFSSTTRVGLREAFPPPADSPHIRKSEPAWPHPEYVSSLQDSRVSS